MTRFRFILIALVCILLLSACGGKPTEVFPTFEALPPPQTATPVPTLPPSPTATLAPTAIPEPTATATQAVLEATFSAWCLPNGIYLPETGYAMPEGAAPSRQADGVTILDGIVQSCTFVYTFNQPMPAGMQMALFDTRPESWFTYPLIQAADNPNIGYAFVNHEFVVNLPYWEVNYRFELQDAAGTTVKSDDVRILRPQNVGYCFGGTLPDPITLKCEFLGEAHPWDPWYGWDLDPKMP